MAREPEIRICASGGNEEEKKRNRRWGLASLYDYGPSVAEASNKKLKTAA